MSNCKLSNCKSLRLFQAVQFSYVEDLEVVLHQSHDAGTMADEEVEIDDGETIGETIHQGKKTWREAMDARKGEGMK